MSWVVYMLECSDGSIYTGITNQLEKRIENHNSGKGARYTRARIPVILKAYWNYSNRSEATKAELQVKKLSRNQKMDLIYSFSLNQDQNNLLNN